jgi:hypothetical protein
MKKIYKILITILLINSTFPSFSQSKGANNLSSDMKLMLSMFKGEFDNFWQVAKEKEDSVKNVHEHIHSIFAPVSVPALGENVFYVKQYMDGNPKKIYRQRLYSFKQDDKEKAVRLDIYSFPVDSLYYDSHLKHEKIKDLTPDKLSITQGCEVYWKRDGERFLGYMKDKACNVISKRSGKKIYITDSLMLDKSQIWIRDEAVDEDGKYVFGNLDKIHHKLKRVTYYKGWISYEKDGKSVFMNNLIFHDQGTKIQVVDEMGNKLPYFVELAQLQYKSGLEIVKLAFYEVGNKKAFLYSWANPGTKNIGINLRWLQAGLTKIEPQSDFIGR